MKKKLLYLCLCLCLVLTLLCACGGNNQSADTEDEAQIAETENVDTPEETTAPEQENSESSVDASAFVGDWHDSIAGRASMTVTLQDGQLCFEVTWPDSAAAYYAFTFAGKVNEQGIVEYDGGFKGIAEFDETGNETKTILSEEESGTVQIAADGTLIWTENSDSANPHEFVRN